MKILVCNDDGIQARGLLELVKSLATKHEVYVVAPSGERSAFSHSLTIHKPLFASEFQVEGAVVAYAIDGTPADCIKFALIQLKITPDIVVSGPNKGSNLGTDVLYSGTVGAASEASIYGLKSIALSSCANSDNDYSICCEFLLLHLEKIINICENNVININFPNMKLRDVRGVVVVPQGNHFYSDRYDAITNGNITSYFLAGDSLPSDENCKDTDVKFLKQNYITITPLTIDRTDYKILKKFQREFL